MKPALFFVLLTLSFTSIAHSQARSAHGPDCSGHSPTDMAFALMKNAGLVDNASIDFTKTKTVRLASEKVGKDLWHQVYLVTFRKNAGGQIQAISVIDSSSDECSIWGVEVFVVSKRLSSDAK